MPIIMDQKTFLLWLALLVPLHTVVLERCKFPHLRVMAGQPYGGGVGRGGVTSANWNSCANFHECQIQLSNNKQSLQQMRDALNRASGRRQGTRMSAKQALTKWSKTVRDWFSSSGDQQTDFTAQELLEYWIQKWEGGEPR